jgi:hypothetical protein
VVIQGGLCPLSLLWKFFFGSMHVGLLFIATCLDSKLSQQLVKAPQVVRKRGLELAWPLCNVSCSNEYSNNSSLLNKNICFCLVWLWCCWYLLFLRCSFEQEILEEDIFLLGSCFNKRKNCLLKVYQISCCTFLP